MAVPPWSLGETKCTNLRSIVHFKCDFTFVGKTAENPDSKREQGAVELPCLHTGYAQGQSPGVRLEGSVYVWG